MVSLEVSRPTFQYTLNKSNLKQVDNEKPDTRTVTLSPFLQLKSRELAFRDDVVLMFTIDDAEPSRGPHNADPPGVLIIG